MKIGILTLHYSNNNYGAVLQSYAISKLIEEFGHETNIIDYQPPIVSLKEKIVQTIRQILGFRFENFRRKHLNRLTPPSTKLGELNKSLDAYIVGSDQVWRYRKNHKVLLTYFLDFANADKTKIAYGASFGLDFWEGNSEITHKINYLLKDYIGISLREKSGVELCKEIFNIDGQLVLDPTLMIDKRFYHELIKTTKYTYRKKYIAYMVLDDDNNVENYFRKLASNKNIRLKNIKGVAVLPSKGYYLFNSINKWLSLLKNSEFVVTDSFHCTVFSVIFKKKFICLDNENRGTTRLKNFLEIIGQSHRFIKNLNDMNPDIIWSDINYSEIESTLRKERDKSIMFLKRNL